MGVRCQLTWSWSKCHQSPQSMPLSATSLSPLTCFDALEALTSRGGVFELSKEVPDGVYKLIDLGQRPDELRAGFLTA